MQNGDVWTFISFCVSAYTGVSVIITGQFSTKKGFVEFASVWALYLLI